MPSAAAARAELATARGGTGPFAFSLAAAADDAAIRRLLRDHPLPGAISLSFEREPDTVLAAAAEGGAHQTLIARARDGGEIAGIAARSVRTVFINGEPGPFGCLGQLRVAEGRHHLRALIDDGFAFCRAVHEDAGDTPGYLMSLVADNDAARRLLIERRSLTAPRFESVGRLQTFLIPSRRAPRASARRRIRIERGTPALLDEIATCLGRNLHRYQFAPCWTAADLASSQTTGLSPDDFAVATTDEGVVGCAALWDQRSFKQVVVRGYAPWRRRTRPLANVAGRLLGLPPLPPVGEALRFAYLSHVAIDNDRGDVLDALIAAQVRRARALGLDYVVTGFPDRHPLQVVVQSWARRTYHSTLYVAYWPDGEAFVHSLDSRPAQPEVAVL